MSLIQFLRILWARKLMILSITVACFLVATTVASLLPKRYQGTARVLMETMRPDPVTGQAISANASRFYIRTQIEFIKDPRVAAAVVDRLGWVNDPARIAAYEQTGRSAVDGGIRNWLAQQIVNRVSADQVAASNILQITYEGRTPEEAREMAGLIRDAYIDASLRIRTDAASRSGDWYREQTDRAREELRAAETAMAQFMQANDINLVGGVDSEAAKLASLQAAVQQARAGQSSNEVMAAARLANDPVADGIRAQIAQLEDEAALVSTRLGPEHPTWKALQVRLGTLRRQLAMAQASSQQGVGAVSGASRRSLAQLEAEMDRQEAVVMARKPIIDQLVLLQQEVNLRRERYEAAARRTAQLQLEAATSETGLVLLGDATASATPSYPNIPLTMVLSALFGLALGILAAIVTEFVARRVRGAEDLAYATGAPVLVTVGGSPSSPLRQRLQRLLGRRREDDVDEGQLQAI